MRQHDAQVVVPWRRSVSDLGGARRRKRTIGRRGLVRSRSSSDPSSTSWRTALRCGATRATFPRGACGHVRYHCRLIGGIDGEMIASQPLDCNHVACTQERCGVRNRIIRHRTAPGIEERQPWSAGSACHGLGMKASIGWIMVFAGTVLTHGKHRHGRRGAVVRDGADDGKPWSAVRAVRQGIAITAIGGLQFMAIGTRGHVWRDEGNAPARLAWSDGEAGVSCKGISRLVTRLMTASGGASRSRVARNRPTCSRLPLPRSAPPDCRSTRSPLRETSCQGVHEGTKAHSLDNALDPNPGRVLMARPAHAYTERRGSTAWGEGPGARALRRCKLGLVPPQ